MSSNTNHDPVVGSYIALHDAMVRLIDLGSDDHADAVADMLDHWWYAATPEQLAKIEYYLGEPARSEDAES